LWLDSPSSTPDAAHIAHLGRAPCNGLMQFLYIENDKFFGHDLFIFLDLKTIVGCEREKNMEYLIFFLLGVIFGLYIAIKKD
jgi:hypothetical protein